MAVNYDAHFSYLVGAAFHKCLFGYLCRLAGTRGFSRIGALAFNVWAGT